MVQLFEKEQTEEADATGALGRSKLTDLAGSDGSEIPDALS